MAMWKEEKKKRNARGSVLRGQGYEILGIGFVLLLLGFGILNLASPDREFSETENGCWSRGRTFSCPPWRTGGL